METTDIFCNTPKMSNFLSTGDILWAPKKKNKLEGQNAKSEKKARKKLNFEDPSSPIKVYERGLSEIRTSLAPCECFIKAVVCHERPCKCPKKRRFNDEKLFTKKKISLNCSCPIECKILQSAQEMF